MSSPVLSISEGKIRGCFGTDLDGKQFFSFLGIPYAKPPVGHLRFKAPQPIEEWNGIKDCIQTGNSCIQKNLLTNQEYNGSEDCLNLNVFTKTLPEHDSVLKPVMVWIHGGGFLMGSNDNAFYGPEYLISKDVVVVSINYRVGFLGFLTLDDPSLEVPGNAAMKDQVLALKWVQRNIKYFNGDRNNVTIFGESAGSGSVHYLVLSPSTKGLFHKAIMQSGVALNPWGGSAFNILDFINFIGKSVEDEKAALEILMEMPAGELVLLQDEYLDTKPLYEVVGPAVEKENPTAFLTKHPFEVMNSGEYNQIPIMMGYTSGEGLVMASVMFGREGPENISNLERYILPEMKVEKGCPTSKLICKRFADYYLQQGNAKIPYMLATDYLFTIGIVASAKIHSRTSRYPVYLYKMTVETALNLWKKMFGLDNFEGVCHGDDIGYLFKSSLLPEVDMGELESTCLQRFLKLWTNFAKYGNPTPHGNDLNFEWQPVDGENVNYLDIGEELTMRMNPDAERVNLWKDVLQLSPATAKYL